MKELLLSILDRCFINCVSISSTKIIEKINFLTGYTYDIEVIKDTDDLIKLLIKQLNITLVFELKNTKVININIE